MKIFKGDEDFLKNSPSPEPMISPEGFGILRGEPVVQIYSVGVPGCMEFVLIPEPGQVEGER